jgi:hypothetical chaperone protein
MPDFCAIDFGTSNSAVALPDGTGVRLVELEAGQRTMPTAVFYAVEGLAAHQEPQRHYGRAALAAYVEGSEGRLMRSMKSILGSPLAQQSTEVGAGRSVRYVDVVGATLRHLKRVAERDAGQELTRLVLGRPVFFVDDDARRDAQAQAVLLQAARDAGFADIRLQYEPIAAALNYETTLPREQLVLVADIGGGTSDFSLVRVGPARRRLAERQDDILASHGVHVAGTDFDRQIELACILPACGYGSRGPGGREVPSKVYFDLATWHLINTVYVPSRVAELARMKSFYADPTLHARLMAVVRARLGHALAAQAEAAKIAVADGGDTLLALDAVAAGMQVPLSQQQAVDALDVGLQRIVAAADQTLRLAGVARQRVDALYLTGGSTGLAPLVQRLVAHLPGAAVVQGDPFASVAQGLGVHAQQVFGAAG